MVLTALFYLKDATEREMTFISLKKQVVFQESREYQEENKMCDDTVSA